MRPSGSFGARAILSLIVELDATGAVRTKPLGVLTTAASCTVRLRAWGFDKARVRREDKTRILETILSERGGEVVSERWWRIGVVKFVSAAAGSFILLSFPTIHGREGRPAQGWPSSDCWTVIDMRIRIATHGIFGVPHGKYPAE